MSSFPTTSFYQFYEHIQQSKLNEAVLLEMRPQGSPSQYSNRNISPHAPATPRDGQMGRNDKNIIDLGAPKDRELSNRDWQQGKEKRPELAVYDTANDMKYAEKLAASVAEKKLGLTSRKGERTRGGKMIQTNKTTGPEDVEAITAISRKSAIKTVEEIKASIQELAPTVKDYSDPKMMKLIFDLYNATSDTTKFYGEMSEEIASMNDWAKEKIKEYEIANPKPEPRFRPV